MHSPSRIPILLAVIQRVKKLFQKLRVSILENGFSGVVHERKLVVHIVHGEEMGACRFLCSNVVDVCSCDAEAATGCRAAASTGAVLLDGSEVLGVEGVAQVERAA